jgi:hypothetical protein
LAQSGSPDTLTQCAELPKISMQTQLNIKATRYDVLLAPNAAQATTIGVAIAAR